MSRKAMRNKEILSAYIIALHAKRKELIERQKVTQATLDGNPLNASARALELSLAKEIAQITEYVADREQEYRVLQVLGT